MAATKSPSLVARQDGDVTADLAYLYYPHAFADASPNGGPPEWETEPDDAGVDERAVDRLVRKLREADVGLVNAPVVDRRHRP